MDKLIISFLLLGSLAISMALPGILSYSSGDSSIKGERYTKPYMILFEKQDVESQIKICRQDPNCMDIMSFEKFKSATQFQSEHNER